MNPEDAKRINELGTKHAEKIVDFLLFDTKTQSIKLERYQLLSN